MEMGRRRRRNGDRSGAGLITDLADVGVGEEVHEEVDGAEAEALVVPGERGLELLVVDHPAPVAVRRLEAGHHVGVGPGRERDGTSDANGLPYPPAGPYAAGGGGGAP
jgi:hypothetical protein